MEPLSFADATDAKPGEFNPDNGFISHTKEKEKQAMFLCRGVPPKSISSENTFKHQALRSGIKELPEAVGTPILEEYGSLRKIDNKGEDLFDFVISTVAN